ncbi:ATP-dependent helicase upf1 [Psilocybe cubensis]|uniref:DNA2/NAM7 helicase-like C-terminal domain-containing protein n=2 Tax=Psilocybe cubensis TaxID=181762 RepID=A0A8H7XWA0_PSICU|nr:ATP-dependent helicase upf1 [Psilocybe cubensis]KAH9482282.1 ATP-dependent helicase upf1 [Psilocybe cubensis]
MDSSSFLVTQGVFSAHHPNIVVQHCHEGDISGYFDLFVGSIDESVIGLAAIYGSKGRMTMLAVSSRSRTLVVTLSFQSRRRVSAKKKKLKTKTVDKLHSLLCDPDVLKVTFYMDKLSAALFHDHGMRITQGKDLLSLSTNNNRTSIAALITVIGGDKMVFKEALTDLFFNDKPHKEAVKALALQAWVAYSASVLPSIYPRLNGLSSINTSFMPEKTLAIVSKTIRDMDRLVALKPSRKKHDVISKPEKQSLIISQRYKTKISRLSGTQRLRITFQRNGKTESIQVTKGVKVDGRQTTIEVGSKPMVFNTIKSVETVGREDPTPAEIQRTEFMLSVLQNPVILSQNPFIGAIWGLPKTSWKKNSATLVTPGIYFPSKRQLNESQSVAVNFILSSKTSDRVILIHGPPGTGKTTVIAAAVTSAMASFDTTRTIWLVAQSNVAVKNIAEKLANVDFWDFKIIVSKDFRFDWHEHLYVKIEENLIETSMLIDDVLATSRQLLGSRVILCTLGMLSNPKLSNVTSLVPPQTVIFDEASQIEIGDYMSLLHRFKSSLQKLVFIGDDKQLAPYGTSDIPELQSIFEKLHLRKAAVFLDTQYRMPVPIGTFISKHVYSGKLKSEHAILKSSCCRFIDVHNGVEQSKGHSWTNEQEVKVVVKIARQLIAQGKSFRIITPYDAQRSLLESSLKNAELTWEDKCFNIDSFQGNEDDYIVVTLVRTAKLGFLIDMRRVNVMLTRCKVGMIICTNRAFMENAAAETLVGKLQKTISGSIWIDGHDVLHKNIKTFV